jgi:hypothetical protein
MKPILLVILPLLILGHPLHAQNFKPAPDPYTEPFFLPKGDLRTLIEISAKIQNRQIVVSNERELDLEIPFILLAPVSADTVKKTIDSVLLLEGYGLVEEAGELHLRKILTEEQCNALNKGLGKARATMPEQPVRREVIRLGPEVAEKVWIIVRPDGKK